MSDYYPKRLSPEAFTELRQIVHAELDESLSHTEIEEIGDRLLRLFSILTAEQAPARLPPILLTKQESQAFSFIAGELRKRKPPSARQVASALGLRSSRSGFLLIQSLIQKGLLNRCEHGLLCLGERSHKYQTMGNAITT
jgi:hypothetical protein